MTNLIFVEKGSIIIAVGAGHRRADGPIYSIFEVL